VSGMSADPGSTESTYTDPVTESGPQATAHIPSMRDRQRQVVLAAPRGYCAGVDRAVITVDKALERY
jgi:4-hydroxy-3-methylbut-2-enyl diphosphate reductase